MRIIRLNPANRTRVRSDEGFTLIELMVALGMFAVALVSMSVMFTTAFTTARSGQNRDAAKAAAQLRMEQLRTLPFFIAFRDQQAGKDPDLLDKFFVDLNTAAATRTLDGVSVTQRYVPDVSGACPDTSRPPACSYVTQITGVSGLALGTLELWVRFVREPDTTTGTPAVAVPPATYSSNVVDEDAPPTKLALVNIVVGWTEAGRPRTFEVDSIIRGIRTPIVKQAGSANASGGAITSLKFLDGATFADIVATLGRVDADSTEADFLQAIAEGTILSVSEVDPITNNLMGPSSFLVRPTGKISDSRNIAGETIPALSTSVDDQEMRTVDASNLLVARIDDGLATAKTALTAGHNGAVPEARSTQDADNVEFNLRQGPTALTQASFGSITSSATITSTNAGVTAVATSRIENIQLWGTHDYGTPVLTIDAVQVTIEVSANGDTGGADAQVLWSWVNLRIFDPATGTYTPAPAPAPGHNCSFDSNDGLDYPPCVGSMSIPAAYGTPLPGETPESCTACSLAITIGATQASALPTGLGAEGFQKNVLNIFFKNQGLRPLETTTFSLGDAAADVSYQNHH